MKRYFHGHITYITRQIDNFEHGRLDFKNETVWSKGFVPLLCLHINEWDIICLTILTNITLTVADNPLLSCGWLLNMLKYNRYNDDAPRKFWLCLTTYFHAISSVCRLIARYSKIIESVIDNNKKYLEDSYNKNMS